MWRMSGGTKCFEKFESWKIEDMGKVLKMEDVRSDEIGKVMLM